MASTKEASKVDQSIKNGLQLRHANSDTPFKMFSYTLAIPHPQTPPSPVDWQRLSLFHVESEHIHIHELKEGGVLKEAIESYRTAHAKAVVIINDKDSRVLDDQWVESLEGFESFLITVLSSSDGQLLFDLLEDEDVYAKLEVTSIESIELGETLDEDTAVLEVDPTAPTPSLIHEQHSRGVLDKLFRSRNTFNLKNEIKKLLIDGEIMKRVTNNAGLFTLVMSTFSQYERVSKPEPSQIVNLIKNYFVPYFEHAFPTEFPFYLILTYRFKKFRHLYECEELGPFITNCIETFEGLTLTKIAETLIGFYEKKDFDVIFGSEEANMSVFLLLATACHDLMNLSIQIKSDKNNGSSKRIFTRMLWITIFLRSLSERGTANRQDADIWQEHLLKQQISVLNDDVIEEFKMGVAFAGMLHLPHDLSFTAHHMTHFLSSEHFMHPFETVKKFYLALECNIRNDRELLVHVLIKLRSHYTTALTGTDSRMKCKASTEGTLLGVIEEGISFLDAMKDMWMRRDWYKGKQDKDFRNEILKWLKLFLGVIKVSDPLAPLLLKKLLSNKRNSVIANQEYRKTITNLVLEETRKNFSQLTVQQFFLLYKEFRIWPINFLHDFLDQYKISSKVKINDATWSEFFNVVLDRTRNVEPQKYLFSFICKIADKYCETERAKDFIPDLLQLDIPRLFITTSNKVEYSEEMISVGEDFKEFLMKYIQRNNLRGVLVGQIQTLISRITDKKEDMNFQWIILSVLQIVVVPELKSLETTDSEQLRGILPLSVNVLVSDISWFGPLSPRQKFCWSVVATACSKITLTANNFEWVQNQTTVNHLGCIFNTYCNSRKLYGDQALLYNHTPQEITSCSWEDVRKYFNFVSEVQKVLLLLQTKFTGSKVNYDELMSYASNNVALNALGRAVHASSFVMKMDITQIKETYEFNFEQLHTYLLHYVPGHPEVKYCTLPALFNKYGVAFPPEIQDTLIKHIRFPGEQRIPKKDRLHNIIPLPSSGRIFEPGQDISLQLSQTLTLADLQKLNTELDNFLKPFIACLDMFVFFHLHQSEIFEKLLLRRLEALIGTSLSTPVNPRQGTMPGGFSLVPLSITFSKRDKRDKVYEGIPAGTLRKALIDVKELLLKIVRGTVLYSDIIAEGVIKLESINMENEFSVLMSFGESLEMTSEDSCEGLNGVRSMLELFQFTQHIQTIDAVFEQYGLKNCRSDPTLKELLQIMKDIRPEESCAKLTPLEAMAKMIFIKESLCLEGTSNYQCLNLLSAIANSAAFYQFIRDKQFTGPRGHTIFHEQYQLITAQLQHEEYDKNVLNHLRVVFEFLSPFMEVDISFKELMRRVSRLDTTHGLKQLETVNENVTLIRLWFSRAEVSTLASTEPISLHNFPNVSILLTDKNGSTISNQKDNPWICKISKGEFVIEIPKKFKAKEGKTPHNYRLYSDPEVTLHASATEVKPLKYKEFLFLSAVTQPSLRVQECLRTDKFKEKLNLKVDDAVIFKMKALSDGPDEYVEGVIRYIGPLDESEGMYFGIEIREEKYLSKESCNGRPYFTCMDGNVNEFFLSIEKIAEKLQEHQVPTRENEKYFRFVHSLSPEEELTKETTHDMIHRKSQFSSTPTNPSPFTFDDIIATLQKLHEEKDWLDSHFDRVMKNYLHQVEKNERLKAEYNQVSERLEAKEEEYLVLEESHSSFMTKSKKEYNELQHLHDTLIAEKENELQKLQTSHETLTVKHQEKEEEYHHLYIAHDQLETSYKEKETECHQLQENNVTLEERIEVMQNELKGKNDQITNLQKQITAMERSWKISHHEVTLAKQELGRGGWGVIWKGKFRSHEVAVKQIHELIVNPHTLELLHREINIMAQLRHPNLLQFIGAVFDHPSGNPLIITEVMDTSLRKAYEEKQLTPDQQPVILSIMRDVAVGLNYLHCLPDPIIHRDVSSANVLLESKGPGKWKTKISDFGSAKIARSATTKAPGAEVYSAPECHQGIMEYDDQKQTQKVDSYSYGVLLCEIASCCFPKRELFRRMLEEIRTCNVSIHDVIVQCVEKEPNRRPSMRQIIETLDQNL